jgi:hypothetical protein
MTKRGEKMLRLMDRAVTEWHIPVIGREKGRVIKRLLAKHADRHLCLRQRTYIATTQERHQGQEDLGGSDSVGFAINASGQAVGYSATVDGDLQRVLGTWDGLSVAIRAAILALVGSHRK